MAALRPAPFSQRQEGDVPTCPASRDRGNAPENWQQDYSRKRPLHPEEGSVERRIQNAAQREHGERLGQGHPERRSWDKSRPDTTTRRPSWDRRMDNDNIVGERQRPDHLGERSKVWRVDTRPRSQNYQRQDSRERPRPEKAARPAFQRRGSNLSNHSRSPSSSSRSDGWPRSLRDAWNSPGNHGNRNKNNFRGEQPKRERTSGLRQMDKKWQSNGRPSTQMETLSIRQAPTKSFAGRFVPRADAADQDEKHDQKQPSGVDEHVKKASHQGEDAKQQDGNSFGEPQQTQPRTVAESQKKVAIVNKVPASLEMKRNSLKDIVKDMFTPELTEASIETSLVASVSYSSCSQSAIAIESPHSLTHPEDEHMETENKDTRDADSKETSAMLNETIVSMTNYTNDFVAAPFTVDRRPILAEDEESAAPAPAHWVRRSTRVPRPAPSVDVNVPMSVTVTKDTDDATAKEEPPSVTVGRILEKDQDASAPVPTHWVRRSVRQPSRSVLGDGEHGASTQEPLASSTAQRDSDSSDSSGDETDEEELLLWAQKMLGVPPRPQIPTGNAKASIDSLDDESESELKTRDEKSLRRPALTLHLQMGSTKNGSKASMQRKPASPRRKGKLGQNKSSKTEAQKEAEEALALEEVKRKKALAKPLTAADVRRILAEDEDSAAPAIHWVRRSDRQPSRSALNHSSVRSLLGKLRDNDYDMTVLKMKKYLSDPDTPQMIIDAALDALEENTNCQALYIQNFNQGMRDEQVLHLLRILQMPSCNIWCLNIGETYNVKTATWDLFAKGLKKTKITHMYASEHTITAALKDEIRESIRKNRFKHDMHISPDNLDVIVQCTHCWWNPINAKVLRPYVSNRGLDYILHDKEAQGLQGSMSAAPAGDMQE